MENMWSKSFPGGLAFARDFDELWQKNFENTGDGSSQVPLRFG